MLSLPFVKVPQQMYPYISLAKLRHMSTPKLATNLAWFLIYWIPFVYIWYKFFMWNYLSSFTQSPSGHTKLRASRGWGLYNRKSLGSKDIHKMSHLIKCTVDQEVHFIKCTADQLVSVLHQLLYIWFLHQLLSTLWLKAFPSTCIAFGQSSGIPC